MTTPVTFLASYPRSGNTWVRVLLYHALHAAPGDSPSTRQIADRLPDLHVVGEVDASLAAHPSDPAIVKTHLLWSPAHAHASAGHSVILLLRHPRDVLLSCMNFHRVLETKIKDRRTGRDAPFREIDYARHFIAQGGDPVWMNQGYGSWADNTRSWAATDLPRLVVRYEDMLDDPAGELARVLDFLGESRDTETIDRAVVAAGFDQMRALEVREKASTTKKNTFFGGSSKTIRKGVYFMDKARRGCSLDAIAPGLDAAFNEQFGEAMREQRYT